MGQNINLFFSEPILSSNFLRKYIHMAKGIVPKLSEQASGYISECYTELRSYENAEEDRVSFIKTITSIRNGNF